MSGTQQLLLAEGGGGGPANYIEDVFSTYLWTGTDATQTITNNIDLSTKGGLVWMKRRDSTGDNGLFDTVRGSYRLISNSTAAQAANSQISSFNTTGFTLSAGGDYNSLFGGIGETAVGWTFRKQPKFFDVVTWSGNSVSGREIPHNLKSVPGCIIVKCTTTGAAWFVWHRSMGGNNYIMYLNSTDPRVNGGAPFWNNTAPTDTVFTVGNDSDINQTGRSYVAYLFAHDAGGFGASGTDNVISCGSYVANGLADGNTITLGYEPQMLLIKSSVGSYENWYTFDSMRGLVDGSGNDNYLIPNLTNAEAGTVLVRATATGFKLEDGNTPINRSGVTYIYIAIRRGPMKVPTDGTTVFKPVTATVNSANFSETSNFPVDLLISESRTGAISRNFNDRLRGGTATGMVYLQSTTTAAEGTVASHGYGFDYNTKVVDNFNYWNAGTDNFVYWNFRRAPSFFDEVCYTGNGTTQNISHNLAAVPELMFIKRRNTTGYWPVYSAALGNSAILQLEDVGAVQTGASQWNSTTPTSSVFSLGSTTGANASGGTYVAYLFATCAGVSKVGSYTGTGTTKQVGCGFAAGARFVMIKRTDSTGDWYVWDSARGIVASNDPYLLLNSTAAEVTNTDYVDTYAAGFEISSTAPAAINASGGTFIFLAIA